MDGQANCTSIRTPEWELTASPEAVDQKWYKPIVSVDADSCGNKHVYKAFRFSRGILGKYFMFLASHEFRMLKKVEHLEFTPSQVSRRSDALPTIHYRLIEGLSIKEIAGRDQVPDDFFMQLLKDVHALHSHGLAHMDLGNSGNILVSRGGRPAIIDFGSAIPLSWLPPKVQKWARMKDTLGILKLWHRFDGQAMPEMLRRFYLRNYRKNIYTPKRFLKALRKSMRREDAGQDLPGLTTVLGLFVGLLLLTTFA